MRMRSLNMQSPQPCLGSQQGSKRDDVNGESQATEIPQSVHVVSLTGKVSVDHLLVRESRSL